MAASPGAVERQGALRGEACDGGQHPVIMTPGPNGKDIHWQDFNHDFYELLDKRGPCWVWDTDHGRSGR